MILPKSVAETAKTEDFNSGKAMIGTGPYRLTEYVAGDRVVLKRNDAYWHEADVGQRALQDDSERAGARGRAAGRRRADD